MMKIRGKLTKKVGIYTLLTVLATCMAAMMPIKLVQAEEIVLKNPIIEEDDSMQSGEKVTWDCIYFGSYPQAEVITTEMSENYIHLDSRVLSEGDLIVDDEVYGKLQDAIYDDNGDTTVNGIMYRRMMSSGGAGSYLSEQYYWQVSDQYHYFQYEPIKWRVLFVNDEKVFLLADKGLDAQTYNDDYQDVTWEKSTIRSWLNGYDASLNQMNVDYGSKSFINTAFSEMEQEKIVISEIENNDNLIYGTEYGSCGGNDTLDKIFLLSESEVYTESAKKFGFVLDNATKDEARRCRTSTYAKAMGAETCITDDFVGNSEWWLRTPGYSACQAIRVTASGWIYSSGDTNVNHKAVRPALNLNLSDNDLWVYAGTVSITREESSADTSLSDENGNQENDSTSGEDKKTENNNLSEENNNTNSSNSLEEKNNTNSSLVTNIEISCVSKKLAAGKKVKLTVNVTPETATDKTLTWWSSNTQYAIVDKNGNVTLKNKGVGKSVTITAQTNDGSNIKATYKISIMKDSVKSVKLSKVSKAVKAGKTVNLKATVKTTGKKVNKMLMWSSSNTKYAVVSKNGVVKTKKAGKGKTVKITAMSTDGSNKKAVVKIKLK